MLSGARTKLRRDGMAAAMVPKVVRSQKERGLFRVYHRRDIYSGVSRVCSKVKKTTKS